MFLHGQKTCLHQRFWSLLEDKVASLLTIQHCQGSKAHPRRLQILCCCQSWPRHQAPNLGSGFHHVRPIHARNGNQFFVSLRQCAADPNDDVTLGPGPCSGIAFTHHGFDLNPSVLEKLHHMFKHKNIELSRFGGTNQATGSEVATEKPA